MQFNRALTRRRFGQLTIASSTLVMLGYFTTRTLAQTKASSTVLVGVLPAYPNDTSQSKIDTNNSSQLIDPTDSGDGTEAFTATATATPTVGTTAIFKPGRELVVNRLDFNLTDFVTGAQTQVPISTGIILAGDTNTLLPYAQISGLAALNDDRLVLATNPINVEKKDNPTRITVIEGNSVKTLETSGLRKQDRLESLAAANNNQLLGLVVKSNGKGDARLVAIDINTGQIDYTEKVKLPGNQRFSTLSQCSDGTMYTTSIAKSGETTLVRLDVNQKKPVALAQLTFEGSPWVSGLKSLACSDANELFALGSRRYETVNYLFRIDPKKGEMIRLREFPAVSIAFARS